MDKKNITSLEIMAVAEKLGEKKALEYLSQAGFDAWAYTMQQYVHIDWKNMRIIDVDDRFSPQNYIKFTKELAEIASDNGLICCQTHAPFPSYADGIEKYLYMAIEGSALVGAKYCVIHPNNDFTPSQNAEFYNKLLPFAKSCNVIIACENMFNWDEKAGHSVFASCCNKTDFLANLNAVNDDHFVACLDIGHAEMRGAGGGAKDMIYALKDRLKCLHIHDNDLLHDKHQIPFTESIDYAPICKALKDVGYSGSYDLECPSAFYNCKSEQEVFETLKKAKASVDCLIELVKNA